ncbi:MAG: PIG-L family deacetylase [Chthonomonadales bacterium]
MKFSKSTADIFVPDGSVPVQALARTTHLGIGAHQDDLEIMCLEGIFACYQNTEKWFSGVIVTNGSGSARDGVYSKYSDEEMMAVRREEQKRAAIVGEFSCVSLLNHTSAEVRDPANNLPECDIRGILEIAKPEVVYIHNLADKHSTHIGTAMQTIRAIRSLPKPERPSRLLGCEVWRALDWLDDDQKVALPITEHENLAQALIGIFDSQVAGGKRYDLAIMGRRRANATFFQPRSVDQFDLVDFAMDLTPLIEDDTIQPSEFVAEHIRSFETSVRSELARYGA